MCIPLTYGVDSSSTFWFQAVEFQTFPCKLAGYILFLNNTRQSSLSASQHIACTALPILIVSRSRSSITL